MRCHVCNVHVSKSALYRQNPKGESGIFACALHNTKTIDLSVKKIVETIDKENKRA